MSKRFQRLATILVTIGMVMSLLPEPALAEMADGLVGTTGEEQTIIVEDSTQEGVQEETATDQADTVEGGGTEEEEVVVTDTAADDETEVADEAAVNETITEEEAAGETEVFVEEAETETVAEEAADDVIENPVAKIGETGYATLLEAVAAAVNGDTIVLQKDAEGDGIALWAADQKTITIDLSSFTYTVSGTLVGSTGTETQAFHFEKGNTVTIKNGTLKTTNALMLIQNYCDLTLDNVTVDGTGLQGSHCYVVSNNNGSLTVKGATDITAKDGDIAFDVWYSENYSNGVAVTFDDSFTGTVTGDMEYGAANGATEGWESKTSLTINGTGTFTGSIKPGNNNDLSTGTITVNAEGLTKVLAADGTLLLATNEQLDAAVVTIEDQEYTGSALTPTATVLVDGIEIDNSACSYRKWKNNTNVGDATVIVSAYDGKIESAVTFDITAIDLSTYTVNLSGSKFAYTGEEIKPTVTVTKDDAELSSSLYTVTYASNTDAGTATVTVTGDGTNVINNATADFDIVNAVATIGDEFYNTFEEAVTAANAMTGDVTIELVADATWTTGASHGSTPLVTAESAVTSLTINGNGKTLTAVGEGIGSLRAANDGVLNFNNMTIKDESVSYAESSWEHGYLEFGGKLNFTDVDFVNAIMLTRDNGQQENCEATFTGCTFNSNDANQYDIWVSQGDATFTECTFTGYRGAKIHEAYGSEVDTVTFTECAFEKLSKKPGLAVGDVNEDTTVIFDTCSFDSVQAGDQSLYVLESDTAITDYNLIIKGTAMVDDVDAVVARIGERGFLTVDSAFAAAKAGDTLEILKAGTYTLPNSLPNITVKGNVANVVFTHTGTGSIASIPDGATFESVTFFFGGNNYHGFQHAGTINMNNCTLNGKFFSYADMTFSGCTFNAPGTDASGVSNKDYSMWAYAGNLTYTNCTFNGAGKFINVYNESGATRYTISATGCSFNSTESNKAAFNVKETCGTKVLQYTVNVSDCTTTGSFPEASDNGTLTVINSLVQVDDRKVGGTMEGGEVVVKVDGEQAYSTPRIARVAAIGDEQFISLQAAIDKATELGGNVTIDVFAGVVELPATAVIPEGVTIKGAGTDKTTLKITTSNGDGVKLTNPNVTIKDLAIDGSEITSGGYKSLINVEANDCVVDNVVMTGGGKSTWNSSILIENLKADQTFTVKNSNISGSFRGVLRESCNANIVIENSELDAVYPFNIDGGSAGTVAVSASKLHGWTSYSGVDKVTFTNCEFSKGKSGYDCIAAYVDTEFVNCTFDSSFDVYAQTSPFNFTFKGCIKDSTPVTREDFKEQFPNDSDVWNKCDTYVDGKLVGAVAEVTDGTTTKEYKTLQAAVNAAHEMTGDVTVKLTADVAEVAVVHQKAGLNLTIDGVGKTITGQLYVDGDGRYNDSDTLTIKNIKFAYDSETYDDAYIDVPSTKTTGKVYTTGKYNYAHNLTVTGCEFAGEGTTTVAVRVASNAGAHDITISGNKATSGHSFAQLTGVKDLTVTNNNVTGVKNGINISGGEGSATISGNTLTANADEGYTVRVKDNSSMNVLLEDNTFSGGEGVINQAEATSVTTITSGKYTGPLTMGKSGKIVISGGVFNTVPGLDQCADGVYPIANTDEATKAEYPYTVGKAVASITRGENTLYFGDIASAIEATQENDTVKLLVNQTENLKVTGTKNFTLDLNGKTLTGNIAMNDDVVTLKNGRLVGTVNVYGSATDQAYGHFTLAEDATIEASFGIILREATGTNASFGEVIDINGTVDGIVWVMGNITEAGTNQSVINVNGTAKITGNDVGIGLNGAAVVNVAEGATITGVSATGTGIEVRAGKLNVTGGTITGEGTALNVTASGSGTTTSGAGIAVAQHTTKLPIEVNISGGSVKGASAIYESDPQNNKDAVNVKVSVTGGVFTATASPVVYSADKNVTLSGGYYSAKDAATDACAAEGKTLTKVASGDYAGMYTLGATVASITEGEKTTYYATLEDAVAAANKMSGKVTIEVLADVEWTTGDSHGSTPLVTADSAVTELTINGNGHKLTAVGKGIGSLRAANNGTLVFNNMTIKDESKSYAEGSWEHGYLEFAGKLRFDNVDFVNAIMLTQDDGQQKNCDATFTNCMFNSNAAGEYDVWVSQGDATFKGCTFTGYRGAKTHEAYGSEVGTLTFTGCKFENISKKPGIIVGDLNANTTIVVDNCTFNDVQAGDQGLYVLESDTPINNYNLIVKGTALVDDVDAVVATIGDTGYVTLDSAFAAAKDGETIKVVKDNAIVGYKWSETTTSTIQVADGRSVTLDLAGHKVTSDLATAFKLTKGTISVIDTADTKGSIEVSGEAFRVTGSTETAADTVLTISEGVNVTSFDDCCVYIRGISTLNTAGNLLSQGDYCTIQGNGNSNNDGTVINVTGGKIDQTKGIAIYVPQDNTMTISGGSITGTTAVYTKAGALTITGGTFTGTGNKNAYEFNGNGCNATGDALVIDNCGYPSGAPTVSITGGFFGSTNADPIGSYAYGDGNEQLTKFVSGGYYSNNSVDDFTVEGKNAVSNLDEATKADYPYTVGEAVAKIDGNYYGTLQSAIDAVPVGTDNATTIVLLKSTNGGYDIGDSAGQAPKSIVLDLGGNTLTLGPAVGSTGTETNGLRVLANSKLEVKNGTVTNSDVANAQGKKVAFLLVNYGDMTLTDVTVTPVAQASLAINNRGALTLAGKTTVNNPTAINDYTGWPSDPIAITNDPYNYFYANKNATLTVDSADVAVGNVMAELYGNATNAGTVDFDISAGKFGTLYTDGSTARTVAGNVTGGLFKTAPAEEFCGKDASDAQLYPIASGDTDYPYTVGEAVAKSGDAYYVTLAEAVNAAKNGGTAVLLKNASGNGIVVPSGSNLTIDFGGFTYDVDGTTVGSTGTETQAFQLLKDSSITFKNGTITSTKAKMLVQNYSNLTLENMVLDGEKLADTRAYTLSTNNGKTTIKDTKIIAKEGGVAFDACSGWGSYASNDVTVTGTSEINGDVEVSWYGQEGTDPATLMLDSGKLKGSIVMAQGADKCTVTEKDAFGAAAPADYKWVSNNDGTSTLKAKVYVAKVGETKYESIAEAIASLNGAAGTVTLVDDNAVEGVVTGPGVIVPSGSNVTIDFAGLTYKAAGELAGSTGTKTQAFQLLKDSNVKLTNGTITSDEALMIVQNYSNLTLEIITLDGTHMPERAKYVLSNNNGKTTIGDKTVINAAEGDFAFDVYNWDSSYPAGAHVTVASGANINGKVEVTSEGNAPVSELTINGGTFAGEVTVADAYVGTDQVKINGGTFDVKPPTAAVNADQPVKYPLAKYPVKQADKYTIEYSLESPDIEVYAESNSYTYTGKQITPEVTVKVAGGETTSLVELAYAAAEVAPGAVLDADDYGAAYGDNVNAGKNAGTITITGKGQFSGTRNATFDIVAAEITVDDIADAAYTGSEIDPKPVVKAGDAIADPEAGYTVAYSVDSAVEGNTAALGANDLPMNAGTYVVTVTPKDNYKTADGKPITKSFKITSIDLSAAEINITAGTSYDYTGQEIKPAVTVKLGEETLNAETDYNVAYEENVRTGVGIITVTGKGNYSGTAQTEFRIHGTSINKATVAVEAVEYTYDGTAKTPEVKSVTMTINGQEVTLVKDKDYSVQYTNNVNAGTAQIVLFGITDFSGGQIVEFKINPAKVEIPKAVEGLTYNGTEQTGVAEGANYTLTGTAKATNAGDYTAVASLNDANHVWSDGTTTAKQLDWTIGAVVAKIGDTYYASLQAALDAATTDCTVELLKDVEVEQASYNGTAKVTLDLGGKTLTGRLTINSGDVTVDNGTIKGRLDAYDASTVTLAAGATVNGQAIVWGDGTFGEDGCKTPTFNVCGTIANAGDSAISTNGTDKSGAKINILEGAKVTSADEIAIYQPSGNVTISGGTIVGTTAVYTKSGTLSVTGGELAATGAATAYNFNGNGAYATGDALVVENCEYPNGAPTVTITGGTFTSANGKQVAGYYTAKAGALATVNANANTLSVPENEMWLADGDGYKLVEAVTVTFEAQGGTEVEAQKIAKGATATKPADPTKDGSVFAGWTLDGEAYDFTSAVNADTKLVAKWSTAVQKPVANTGLVYNGAEQPGVAKGEGYTLTGTAAATAAGDYTASATLDDGYAWSDGDTEKTATVNWSIAKAPVTVTADDASKVFGATDPTLTATVGEGLFNDDPLAATDYTVARAVGEDVGTYAITVTDAGTNKNYVINGVEGTFTITPAKLPAPEAISDQPYTGQALTPTVVIKNGEATLTENTEYTVVSYLNNTELGEAAVIITGAGNYTGMQIAKFNIVEANKALLKAALDAANAARVATSDAQGFDLESGTAYVTSEVQNDLTAAIERAQAVYDDPAATEEQIAQATENLNDAIETYKAKIKYAKTAVAKIGDTLYTSLADAVAASRSGDTVELLVDASGAGIFLAAADEKAITIDLGGHTYTVTGPAVGSTGTATQGLHAEKGNAVTLRNGTFTSTAESGVYMLVQNYCNLTLEDVALDGTNLPGNGCYALSNNCGKVTIGSGTTITANEGSYAFDVCATNYYPAGAQVTVEEGATINGDVQYDVWGTKPSENKATLTVNGGTFNGSFDVEAALAEDAESNIVINGGAFKDYSGHGYEKDGYTLVQEDDGYWRLTPQIDLATATITLTEAEYVYDKSEKLPTVSVTDADGNVVDSNLYTTDVASKTDVGSYTVTVTADENQTLVINEGTANWAIVPAALTSAAAADIAYTGEAVTPNLVVYAGDTTVTAGDYTVTYADAAGNAVTELKEVGSYVATVTGTGNYGGTVVCSFDISQSVAAVTVEAIADQTYDGNPKTPALVVKADGVATTEYTATWINNVNAGTAVVQVTLTGAKTGEALATFTIKPAEVAAPTAAENLVYNGSEQIGVAAGDHYTVTDGAATDAGEYRAVAQLESANYAWRDGTTTAKLVDWSIAKGTVAVTIADIPAQLYSGSAIEPKVTVTTNPEGVAYELSFSNNVEAGNATVTVTTTDPNYNTVIETKDFTIRAAVAKVGDTYFSSVNAAVAAAQDGDTIELLVNKTEGVKVADKTITLDLGGFELSDQTCPLEVSGSADVTVTNGTLKANSYGARVVNSATLTVTDGTTVQSGTWGVYAGNTATLNVEGGEITGVLAISTNGLANQDATINISGGVVNGNVADSDNYSAGVYLPSGTLNITGGTVTGNEAAIAQRGGTVSISGGELSYINTHAEHVGSIGDRTNSMPVGVIVVDVMTSAYPAAPGATVAAVEGAKLMAPACGSIVTGFDATDADAVTLNEGVITSEVPVEASIADGCYAKSTDDGLYVITALTELVSIDAIDVQAYTGSAIEPAVTVYDENGDVVDPANYEVTYEDNIDAGAATVTVKATGEGYTGELTATFVIAKGTLAGAEVTVDPDSYVFDGSAKEPAVTVTLDGVELAADADYTVAYANNTNAGTATVTITAAEDGLYDGTTGANFTITPADMNSVTVETSTKTYTGQKQVVGSVKLGDYELTAADYDVVYVDNVEVGTATAVLSGKGNFEGMISATFEIVGIDLSEAEVTLDPTEFTYDGTAKEPAVTVTLDGAVVDPANYDVAYADNVEAGTGTATATITGKGGYTGSKSATFDIVAATLEGATIDAIDNQTFTGSAIEPEVTVRDAEGNVVDPANYTVSFENNTDIGEADVTVTFTGNYTGEVEGSFNIVAPSKDELEKAIADATAAEDGVTATDDPSDLKPGDTYVPQEAQDALDAAQAAAQAVYDDPNATPEQIAEATENLNKAIEDYEAAKQTVTTKTIDEPTAIEDLVYNGSEQTGVEDGEGYSVENNTATDAGTYKATATLDDPETTTWPDGTTDPKTVVFEIGKATEDDWEIAAIEDKTYTGSAIEPELSVTLKANDAKLTEGTDYQVLFINNTDAGTATVVVVGKGNLSGTKMPRFTIKPATVEVPTAETGLTYTGDVQTGVKEGDEYKLSGNTGTDAGDYTATVKLADAKNYTWTDGLTEEKSVAWTIGAADASKITVADVEDQNYTGSEIKPTPVVTFNGKVLTPDTDFTFSYKDNTNVGEATITVTAKSENFTGSTTKTFNIVAGKVEIPTGKTLTFTGAEQTGVDTGNGYTLSGNTGTDANEYTATAKLADAANFTWADGTTEDKSVAWKIEAADISALTVSEVEDETYTGSEIKPTPEVKLGSVVLTADEDYTLTYADNVNAGKATITVTGKGNVTGSKDVNFTIAPVSLTECDASVEDQPYTKTARKPVPTVTYGELELVNGTDFTIKGYENNIKPGYGTVTIEGKGNYVDSVTLEFIIRFKDVPPEHEYYEDVHRAASLGLVNGYSGAQLGNFGPEDSLQRCQVAVMLWNLAGKPAPEGESKDFKDIKGTEYYASAVAWASSVGVVNGYSGARTGYFGPTDPVQHEELCTMVANYAKNIAGKTVAGTRDDFASFSDAAAVKNWAVKSVGFCFSNGLTTGFKGKINPQGEATRAETASMVYRLYLMING